MISVILGAVVLLATCILGWWLVTRNKVKEATYYWILFGTTVLVVTVITLGW